jgi:hypothetical protein
MKSLEKTQKSKKMAQVLRKYAFWDALFGTFSLVCNMWKDSTRPTSASDFFLLFFVSDHGLTVGQRHGTRNY